MRILVTGGSGYIGSHTVLELLQAGHDVTVIDNLSNSCEEPLHRVKNITGRNSLTFHRGDVLDRTELDKIFSARKFDAVIHFAGLKAVGESVLKPLTYYQNNIVGTVTLCQVMEKHEVRTLVFSSSATVYGDPATVPIREDFPTGNTTNPYGRSKLMIEEILADMARADPQWNIARLRYFNPVGAHESGLIGEDPTGIPGNLMPYICQVATGKLKELSVYGNDYPTPDGTGVRDYIHVVDLALGHLKALDKLRTNPGLVTYNLGTGTGYSVMQMVKAFEQVNGIKIPIRMAPRRDGDIATCYADPGLAKKELDWTAIRTLEDMLRHAWNWQSRNPDGY
ncbi:MAG: UDP-glucose 4-epimerase GalE [Alphaproteobacteria bacterium]|nr:MAG: UDP-glucose 4-epimerase GalE [Alphaproteobacteria bacterium]